MKPLCNILCAYPYVTPAQANVFKNQPYARILIDSGAFTAWKAGKKIDVDDYCKFLETLPFKPWRYFALDVIGDPHGTLRNYQLMLNRGFKPIPIFTRGEDISVLEDYYKTSEVVGIGGLVGTRGNKGFVKGIMQKVKGRKCHWLGFTNLDFIKFYKPYSCDSSTFISGARYGTFKCYEGNGKFINFKKIDFQGKPSLKTRDVILSYGRKVEDFAKLGEWHGGDAVTRSLGAHSIVRYMMDVETKIGTLIFAAVTVTIETKNLLDSYKWEVQNNAGSFTPASSKPLALSLQAGQTPHGVSPPS